MAQITGQPVHAIGAYSRIKARNAKLGKFCPYRITA
jgi:hypothetical protein